MAQYPGAIDQRSPNYWAGRNGASVEGIILHGTAGGTGQSNADLLCSQARQASVHFVVGQDGRVWQLVNLEDSAWGNGEVHNPSWPVLLAKGGNPNTYTVSIEHAKQSSDNSDALTDAQQAASLALVRWLLQELPARGLASADFIAARDSGNLSRILTGHFAIDSINRARCPGNFNWPLYATAATPASKPEEDDMEPAVIKNPDGSLEPVWVQNGNLNHAYLDPAHGWVTGRLGTGLEGQPTVGQWPDGHEEVFAFRADGALVHTYRNNKTMAWAPVEPL